MIEIICQAIKDNANPLMSFDITYAVRELLRRDGYFHRGMALKYFSYRVDHGNGYITQHSWERHQRACRIKDVA